MKKAAMLFGALLFALGLSLGNAEAARLGGGKSFGMQRQSVAPRPAAPAQQATPTAPTTPAGSPAATPRRNWMGPLAGLAAGLGIAALLSHFGMGEGMANLLMIGLLAMAAVFVFKWLFGRSTPQARLTAVPNEALQYSGVANPGITSPSSAATQSGLGSAPITVTAPLIPEGFDGESFLRIAKLNFVRLQAANDAKDLDDIREFVSPEMYAEIKMQMDERGASPQRTEIVTLNAGLLEVANEPDRHVASVHFSGLIRENAGTAAEPFNEVWHLSKPTEGNRGWIIAGIQQLA